MNAQEYRTTDWRETVRAQETPAVKRAIYALIHPFLSANAGRFLSSDSRNDFNPDAVYFTRGTPHSWRRSWGARGVDLNGATILIQGTGTGWDVLGWAEMRPARIIATDLYPFEESWTEIAAHCRKNWNVAVEFHTAPLEKHEFLDDGSVDFCTSNAVLEHCTDIAAVLRESHRVLKPAGRLYACYGPMWFAPGGDHFSGRDGLDHAYNHVALDPAKYQAYVDKNRHNVEDVQSGLRYVELDLFSKMTTSQYLAAFEEAGFIRDGLVLEIAPEALAFRKHWPDRWEALKNRHGEPLTEDDFLIKSNFIRLCRAG